MMKINKMKVYLVITLIITAALMVATPFMIQHECSIRGAGSMPGGEAIAWLIPGLVYALVRTLLDISKY